MNRTSSSVGKSHRGPNMSQTTSKRILHLLARQLGVPSDDPVGIIVATQIHRENINWEQIGMECNIQKQLARKHFNEVIKPKYESFGSVLDAKDKAEFIQYIIALLYNHHYPSASMLEKFTPSSGHKYSRVILRRAFHNVKKSRTLQECYKAAGYTFSNLLSQNTLPHASKKESTKHRCIADETSAQTSSTSSNSSPTTLEGSLTPSLGVISVNRPSRSISLPKSLDSCSVLPLPSTPGLWRKTATMNLKDIQRLNIDNGSANISLCQHENEIPPQFVPSSPMETLQSSQNAKDIFLPDYQTHLQWQRSYSTLSTNKLAIKPFNSWTSTYPLPTTICSQPCTTKSAFALPPTKWASSDIAIPIEQPLAQAHNPKIEHVIPLPYDLSNQYKVLPYLAPDPLSRDIYPGWSYAITSSDTTLSDASDKDKHGTPSSTSMLPLDIRSFGYSHHKAEISGSCGTSIVPNVDQSYKVVHPSRDENNRINDLNSWRYNRSNNAEVSSIFSNDLSFLEPSIGGTDVRIKIPVYKVFNQ